MSSFKTSKHHQHLSKSPASSNIWVLYWLTFYFIIIATVSIFKTSMKFPSLLLASDLVNISAAIHVDITTTNGITANR